MDTDAYFKAMTAEFDAVKDKVRNMIGDAHWLSDGAWKESVLRSAIRGYLPPNFTVGSGFIVTPDDISSQIDVLVCDDSAPLFFRDGDFLITPADCVRAIVEVKTNIRPGELRDALARLDRISAQIKKRCTLGSHFFGLFSFQSSCPDSEEVLNFLGDINSNTLLNLPINALCLGAKQFCLFWERDPLLRTKQPYNQWHAYSLPDTAPAYFVHNLVESLFPRAFERSQGMWFPKNGKEQYLAFCRERTTIVRR